MSAFARAYPDEAIVQEVLAQITWYHTVTLLDKVKDPAAREWYIHKTIANGWSRNVLVHQIESGLCEREGRAVTNFSATLPGADNVWIHGCGMVAHWTIPLAREGAAIVVRGEGDDPHAPDRIDYEVRGGPGGVEIVPPPVAQTTGSRLRRKAATFRSRESEGTGTPSMNEPRYRDQETVQCGHRRLQGAP